MTPRQKETLTARRRALLESYIAPEVVAHILSDGRTPLASGIRTPATVLFADIRGFTRFAAISPAKHVVAFLDAYFEAMSGPATATGATIDKLIGDAVMVVFGVPRLIGNEAERAIVAATWMHKAFARLLRRWRGSLPAGVRLGLGIGCASGEVILANIGSSARMDYTVIGEAVNLAARLTGMAGDGITLVSEDVRRAARAGKARLHFSRSRRLAVKGILGSVVAYAAEADGENLVVEWNPTATDPVCGMKLPAGGLLRVLHGSKTYYFCSATCRTAFRRSPQRFVASTSGSK